MQEPSPTPRSRLTAFQAILAQLRGEILYTLGSVATSIVSLLASCIAARALPPHELGIIQTLLLIPAYLSVLHLGVLNGLNRNIAIYRGRGDSTKVQSMIDSSWRTAHLVAIAGVGVCLAFAAYYLLTSQPRLYLWGLSFVLCTLVLEPYSQHMDAVFLSSRNFQRLATALLWQNVLTALTSLLPLRLGAAGVIVARIVYIASRFAVRLRGLPLPATGRGSWAEIRELAATGMPLLLAGTLYNYLAVADRSVVAWKLGARAVGQLSLAGMVLTGLQFVPLCVALVFYPRVAAHYGRTNSPGSLRPYFWKLLAANLVPLVPLSCAAYWLIRPVAQRFLPAYVPGIQAAEWAALSSLSFAYMGVSAIIAVLRRNTPYIVCMAACLGGVWLMGVWSVERGLGIMGVVGARAVASSVLCVFTIGYAYWLTAESDSSISALLPQQPVKKPEPDLDPDSA